MSDNPTTPVLVTPKPWYTSKTIWVNGLTIAGAAMLFLIGAQTAGELPFVLDAKWVAFILGLINFGLRFITVAPIAGTPAP